MTAVSTKATPNAALAALAAQAQAQSAADHERLVRALATALAVGALTPAEVEGWGETILPDLITSRMP